MEDILVHRVSGSTILVFVIPGGKKLRASSMRQCCECDFQLRGVSYSPGRLRLVAWPCLGLANRRFLCRFARA